MDTQQLLIKLPPTARSFFVKRGREIATYLADGYSAHALYKAYKDEFPGVYSTFLRHCRRLTAEDAIAAPHAGRAAVADGGVAASRTKQRVNLDSDDFVIPSSGLVVFESEAEKRQRGG